MRKGWLGRHDSGMSEYGLQRAFVSVGLQMRKGRLGRYIRGACIRNKAGMHHCTRAHPRRRKRGPTQRAARRGRMQACVCTHPCTARRTVGAREDRPGARGCVARACVYMSQCVAVCVLWCVHVCMTLCVCSTCSTGGCRTSGKAEPSGVQIGIGFDVFSQGGPNPNRCKSRRV